MDDAESTFVKAKPVLPLIFYFLDFIWGLLIVREIA